MISPAVEHQVKFSHEVDLFNRVAAHDISGSMRGGGPSVVHHVSIPSHVRGRTTVTYPDIIDLIDAYMLSNKRRGKVTPTYTILQSLKAELANSPGGTYCARSAWDCPEKKF